jgi:hypothetical protein
MATHLFNSSCESVDVRFLCADRQIVGVVVVIPGEKLWGHPLDIIRDGEIVAHTEDGGIDSSVDEDRVA